MATSQLRFEIKALETPLEDKEYNFVEQCATVYSKDGTEPANIASFLLSQMEEEEIIAAGNPESSSYQRLKDTMTPIMEKLQCNIIVVIGHKDVCYKYIQFNEFGSNFPTLYANSSTTPTIVLMVACLSNYSIDKFNTRPDFIKNNLFFFGFEGLVHIVDGEILACKLTHLAVPFLNCKIQDVEDDLRIIESNLTQFNTPYEKQLNLIKCCKGRYEHFKEVFYNYLSKRQCVKFTTESLFEKLQNIRSENGSLVRHISIYKNKTAHMSMEQAMKYTFLRSDGIPCTEAGNCSGKSKYNLYKGNLKKFDEFVKYGSGPTTQLLVILEESSRYSSEERVEKDKEILTLLKGLPNDLAKKTLLHAVRYIEEDTGESSMIPIFYLIFAENYPVSTYEILKTYDLPLDNVFENRFTLIYIIWKHLTKASPSLTEKEVYRLFKTIGKKNPNALYVALIYEDEYNFIFEDHTKCFLSLVELLFRYFPQIIPKVSYKDLFYVLLYNKKNRDWTVEQSTKVIELFGAFDKFNNVQVNSAKDQDFFKQEIYSVEFVILLYIYVTEDATVNLTESINKYSIPFNGERYIKTPYGEKIYKQRIQYLKYLQSAKRFFITNGRPESLRKTSDEMQVLLNNDLESMETSAFAIDNVKTYISSVTPDIQKRKDLNTTIKSSGIQTLVSIYKNIDATKNQGEDSLRRLQEMNAFYKKFLTQHPRKDKIRPRVEALRKRKVTDSLWLSEKVAKWRKKSRAIRPITLRNTNNRNGINNQDGMTRKNRR